MESQTFLRWVLIESTSSSAALTVKLKSAQSANPTGVLLGWLVVCV